MVTEDEELTPTLENMVILTWLRLIHPSLPKLVKQRHRTELKSWTLVSIKPEISQALSSLLDEICASDDAKILHTVVSSESHRPAQGNKGPYRNTSRKHHHDRIYPLCKQAGRSEMLHLLSDCSFLPDNDRRYIVKARQIVDILNNESDTDDDVVTSTRLCDPNNEEPSSGTVAYSIQTQQSLNMMSSMVTRSSILLLAVAQLVI